MEKKYPVLKCNEEFWKEIKPVLESFGINYFNNDFDNFINPDFNTYPFLVTNYGDYDINEFKLGLIDNPQTDNYSSLRYLVNTKEEFLSAVAKLLGKEIHETKKDKGSDLDIDKPMEKINIADKLKYCKKGIKLYSPIFGEVEFDSINYNAIYVNTINNDNEIVSMPFESNGQFYSCYPNGECILFPSKDNRDWNNFQVLEKGHRVMCSDDALYWSLAIYLKDNIVNPFTKDIKCYWKYIVPAENFDFTAEDITINKEKSIV